MTATQPKLVQTTEGKARGYWWTELYLLAGRMPDGSLYLTREVNPKGEIRNVQYHAKRPRI